MTLAWKNAAVIKNPVETTLTKTKLQYSSKAIGKDVHSNGVTILFFMAQLWNFRLRTIQNPLQKQMQEAFVKIRKTRNLGSIS